MNSAANKNVFKDENGFIILYEQVYIYSNIEVKRSFFSSICLFEIQINITDQNYLNSTIYKYSK